MVAEASPQPYTDVAIHVRDELRRAWLRVEYQIRLGWTKVPRSLGEEASVGPEDMGSLFAAARGEPVGNDESGAPQILEQWLDVHRRIEARIRATLDAKTRSPLVDLVRTFELTPRQWAALMFALLPEVDPNLVQAYRYLSRDASCRGLDGRLLAQLVYDTPQTRSLMARDFSASSPLAKYRLLDASGTPNESLMFRRIRALPRLVYLLDGNNLELDPELAEIAQLRVGRPAGAAFPPLTIERAAAALHSNEVLLAIQGQRGLGKMLLAQVAAAHWGRRLLVIDSKRLAQQHISAQPLLVHSLIREILLLGAIPVFADVDDATVLDDDRDGMPAFFEMFLDDWTGPVALTINRERMPRIHQRPIVHLTLEVPDLAVRAQLWQQVMHGLSQSDADGLAGRFAIPGGVIVAAAHAAEAGRMPTSPPPVVTDLDFA